MVGGVGERAAAADGMAEDGGRESGSAVSVRLSWPGGLEVQGWRRSLGTDCTCKSAAIRTVTAGTDATPHIRSASLMHHQHLSFADRISASWRQLSAEQNTAASHTISATMVPPSMTGNEAAAKMHWGMQVQYRYAADADSRRTTAVTDEKKRCTRAAGSGSVRKIQLCGFLGLGGPLCRRSCKLMGPAYITVALRRRGIAGLARQEPNV